MAFDPFSFVSSTLSGLAGEATGEALDTVRQSINDRSVINIAPIGVNLGEIIRPFNEGSPANGGYGLEIPSRYRTTPAVAELPLTGGAGVQSGGTVWTYLILGAMAVAGFFILRK